MIAHMVRLGDIVEIRGGGTPSKDVPDYWNGNIPWASVKDFKSAEITETIDTITEQGVANSATNIIPAGNILMPTRMSVGKVAINKVPMAINQDLKALFPASTVDIRYLFHSLLANRHMLERHATGATVKGITLDVVKALQIPLPSLAEQKRIAAILDKADQLRQKRRQAIALLDSLTQSIFLEMFGHITNTVQLMDVCDRITDGTHQAPNWSTDGIPFLFVSNIRNQAISFESNKYVSKEEYSRLTKNCRIEAGDVLYTAVGSYGHAAVVPLGRDFIFQRHIAHIKPKIDQISPQFLAFALESTNVRQQADRVARGVAQKTVTLASIREFVIPLPNIDKQKLFEHKISKVRQLAFGEQFDHLNSFFSSLQHRAFSGQL